MTDQHDSAALTRSAYHEAGHIVAAQAFGRPIVSVSIDPGASRGAHIGIWPTARNADVIRETLVILSSGPIAAMIFDPTADPGDGGAGGDVSQMYETCWTLIGRAYGTAEMLQDELRTADRRAAKLIARNWEHVEAVARSLVEHHFRVTNGPTVSCVEDLDE